MSRKNIVLATALALVLSTSAPVSAMTRDGGPGTDPIQRIIKIIKKLLTPGTHDILPEVPHP